MAHHVSSPLCRPLIKSLPPSRGILGTVGGQRWRWGASLKGIITVSPEEVHIITVSNRLDWGREKSIWLLEFLAPRQSHTTAGERSRAAVRSCSLPVWYHGTEGRKLKEYSAVFALRRSLISLLSMAGWPPGAHLSVLSKPVGAVWTGGLPDSVIVWSGVLWRRSRVIASWPVSVGLVLRRLLWAGAAQYSLPGLCVLRLALSQRLDLWSRPVLIQGRSQRPVTCGPLQNAYLRWGRCW